MAPRRLSAPDGIRDEPRHRKKAAVLQGDAAVPSLTIVLTHAWIA